ncbi:hypothetical protein C8J56DRAFT_939865, partial [Mycena floridula]
MLVLFLWQIARALSASMALHCVAVLYSLGMSHSGFSPLLCSSAHSIAPARLVSKFLLIFPVAIYLWLACFKAGSLTPD